MARPKPVPWTRLVTELSSRVKGSKIVSMSSGAMPMPSSLTVKRREAKLARGLGVWTRSNSTVPPLGGVLHGIGDDVDENLVDAELVAHHETVADPGDVDPEVLALGEGPGPRDGNHVLGQLRELELREVEGGLAALDLGHVEDVVEQAQHVQGGGLDLAGVVAHEVGVAGVAEEERGQAHDGVHGGADVVAHVGQERALGLVGHLGHGEGLPQHLLVAALPGAVGQHRHAATAAVDLHVVEAVGEPEGLAGGPVVAQALAHHGAAVVERRRVHGPLGVLELEHGAVGTHLVGPHAQDPAHVGAHVVHPHGVAAQHEEDLVGGAGQHREELLAGPGLGALGPHGAGEPEGRKPEEGGRPHDEDHEEQHHRRGADDGVALLHDDVVGDHRHHGPPVGVPDRHEGHDAVAVVQTYPHHPGGGGGEAVGEGRDAREDRLHGGVQGGGAPQAVGRHHAPGAHELAIGQAVGAGLDLRGKENRVARAVGATGELDLGPQQVLHEGEPVGLPPRAAVHGNAPVEVADPEGAAIGTRQRTHGPGEAGPFPEQGDRLTEGSDRPVAHGRLAHGPSPPPAPHNHPCEYILNEI